MAKTSHVVLIGKSRGHEDGDVVAVEPDVAARLVENGLARKPRSGEVKAAAEGK
jgi:hypothetical protein